MSKLSTIATEQSEELLMFFKFMDVLPERGSSAFTRLSSLLANYLNDLIQVDFVALSPILHRLGIREKTVKNLLDNAPTPEAKGVALADLILEHQYERMKRRLP